MSTARRRSSTRNGGKRGSRLVRVPILVHHVWKWCLTKHGADSGCHRIRDKKLEVMAKQKKSKEYSDSRQDVQIFEPVSKLFVMLSIHILALAVDEPFEEGTQLGRSRLEIVIRSQSGMTVFILISDVFPMLDVVLRSLPAQTTTP